MTHPPLTYGDVIPDRARIAEGIGLQESDLVPDVPLQVASTGNEFLYVALKDARAVDAAISDKARLTKAFGAREALPVFLFTATGQSRLYSRMFAPGVFGIDEDPATGSGSGPLGAFAVRYGLIPWAANVVITSEQGTKMRRQSFVQIRLAYGADKEVPTRIEVGGGVKPVVTGILVGADR